MNPDVSKFARDYHYVKTKVAVGIEESVRGRTNVNIYKIFHEILGFTEFHLASSSTSEEYRLVNYLIEDIERTVNLSREAKMVLDEVKKLVVSAEVHNS
jgi:hypothetical protein